MAAMAWTVALHDEFDAEFDALPEAVRKELIAMAGLLEEYGPRLGRPHADTLAGSRHANMKELRFAAANGIWRVAFAFDPQREAIVLVAGDKAGVAQKRFYTALIAKADRRWTITLRLSPRGRSDDDGSDSEADKGGDDARGPRRGRGAHG